MYTYYLAEFGGTKIQSPGMFSRYLFLAKAFMKIHVCDADKIDWQDDTVKHALCILCEIIRAHSEKQDIASESWDGISVTYRGGDPKQTMADVLNMLLPHELLYRGVKSND